MALNFRPYDDAAGRETRARWSRGLEGVMEAYLASKQNAQQQGRLTQQDALAAEGRVNAEKDRQGANLLQYGFDPRQVTPDVLARSQPGMAPQGPAQPGMQTPEQAENPLFGAVRAFMEKKKSAASMASQEQALGMDKTRSEIRENNAQADALGREQVYVDPMTGKQITIPRGAKLLPPAAKQDGRILPANTVMALNEGQAVARMLPDVEKAIKSNEGIMGPIGGRARGANPYDTNAQTTDAQFRAASQSFGRFMEGGVLRKEDEEKYRKMFPQFSDKPDVAKNKLSIVRRLLASKYESDRTTMGKSGYDVSGLGTLEIPASLFDAQDASGKIRVTNGSEVLLIDAADEADAAKDGYKRAQ